MRLETRNTLVLPFSHRITGVLFCWLALGNALIPTSAQAASPLPEEMAQARQWLAASFGNNRSHLPFSFTLAGKPSVELLPGWREERTVRRIDDQRTEHILSFLDPRTNLLARCVAVQYQDFPTIEWTLFFANQGTSDSPLLKDIQALDTKLERGAEGEFILHHNQGITFKSNELHPYATALAPKHVFRRSAPAGRSCELNFPFFNLAWPGKGVIVAIGWPGQWACDFTRDAGLGLQLRAGQECTHFKLHPGEEVRSPRIVMQFWKGERIRAHNLWRRWMLAYNVPRPGGRLPPTFWAACTGGQYHDIKTMQSDEKGEFAFLQRYLAEGLKPDYWWIDAGWYPTRSNHWWDVGTWETDPKRFPRGIRSIANEVHARGMKLILWFEPERVAEGTWLAIHHPEWLLKRPNSPQGEKLLDLGNPAARRWLTDRVHNLIQEQGVDVYRHDFNCQPLDYWRKNDAPDRQGITEIKYLTGLLAYYDDLLRRNPRLLIDNCSSGGCRNDLDMLRRSIPLWRSDLWNDALGAQNVTHALSFWLPYHSTGSQIMDGYTVSSHLTTHYNAGWDVRKKDVDYGLLRHLLKKHQETAPYYTGDYYPLTSYSLEERVWMAWQFDRPDLGAGLVQVFRRPACPEETLRVKLQGLQAAARYTVSGREGLRPSDTDGKSLMENGLLLSVKDRPGALTITYKRKT